MNSFAKFTGKTPVPETIILNLQLLKKVSGTGVLLVNFSKFARILFSRIPPGGCF